MNSLLDRILDRFSLWLDRVGAVWFFCYFATTIGIMLWLVFSRL